MAVSTTNFVAFVVNIFFKNITSGTVHQKQKYGGKAVTDILLLLVCVSLTIIG